MVKYNTYPLHYFPIVTVRDSFNYDHSKAYETLEHYEKLRDMSPLFKYVCGLYHLHIINPSDFRPIITDLCIRVDAMDGNCSTSMDENALSLILNYDYNGRK